MWAVRGGGEAGGGCTSFVCDQCVQGKRAGHPGQNTAGDIENERRGKTRNDEWTHGTEADLGHKLINGRAVQAPSAH